MFGKAPTRTVVTFPCAHPEIESAISNRKTGASLCSTYEYLREIFIVANDPIKIIKLIDIINLEGKANDMPLAVSRWLSNRLLNQQLKRRPPFGENAGVQVIAVFLP
jgi:hypothetical protein